MVTVKSLIFKAVHEGATVPGKDIGVEKTAFNDDQPISDGDVVLHVLYASFDPFMRGRMRAKTVFAPYKIGEPIPATCIAEVVRSSNPTYAAATLVRGTLPISQYVHLTVSTLPAAQLEPIQNPHNFTPDIFLGALGMPGLAAYASFFEIGKPKSGETFFVTAAAGAVGHVVGQLAKLEGLRVIGSAGSDDKVRWLTEELGFDAAFNYKTEPAAAALKRLAPDGLDIYFDNTGGEQLDAALMAMRPFGRVIGCGMMSMYNRAQGGQQGIQSLFNLVTKRLTMRGFIVIDPEMGPKYQEEFQKKVPSLIEKGSLKAQTTVTDGIDAGPEGFVGMLRGNNMGKAVLKL